MGIQHEGSTSWPESLILLNNEGTVWFDSTDLIVADYHYQSGAVESDVPWAISDAVTGEVQPASPSTGEAGLIRVIIWRITTGGYRESFSGELLWAVLPSSVTGSVAAGTGTLRTVVATLIPVVDSREATVTLTVPVALGTEADIQVWSSQGQFPPVGQTYSGAGTVTLSSDRLTITALLPAGSVWQDDDWCAATLKVRS